MAVRLDTGPDQVQTSLAEMVLHLVLVVAAGPVALAQLLVQAAVMAVLLVAVVVAAQETLALIRVLAVMAATAIAAFILGKGYDYAFCNH